MKVILTTNIKKLGKIGDLVEVKNGYARNFLFPNKMALRDSKKNLEYYNNIKEEIKSSIRLSEIISKNVSLKRRDKSNYIGLCPFHSEKSGSFTVSVEKKLFYCFGCHWSCAIMRATYLRGTS